MQLERSTFRWRVFPSPFSSISFELTCLVVQVWSDSADLSQWKKNAQAALDAGSTHLLAFNEPDLGSQGAFAFPFSFLHCNLD
jgi:hypothetical protein